MVSAEAQSHGQFGEDRVLREIFGEQADWLYTDVPPAAPPSGVVNAP